MYSLLAEKAHNGILSKDAFDSVIRRIVNETRGTDEDEIQLSDAQKAYVSYQLRKVFHAYDRDEVDEVPVKELACGFSLFTAGGKRQKLEIAFASFASSQSPPKRNALGRTEMHRFLRAILTVFFALNEDWGARNPSTYTWDILDKSSSECTAVIFQSRTRDPDLITFEEFTKQFDKIPWLELLDLDKWSDTLDSVNDINS
mmetsp:Transcript_9782/g.11147  ORF Transcript_9782/g.11147 Transcript_9782/m.11147 type:complete len:201 (+) Transcript_9782:2-604(+)